MPVQYSGDRITFSDGSTVGSGWSGFKNRIINGDMRIDQRNAGASVTPAASSIVYTLDRWLAYQSLSSRFSIQRNANSVTPPAGFTNYLGVTSLTGTAPASTDINVLVHRIEGFNTADLAFGTSSASAVTLSFWVRSSLTGSFGASLKNNANNRSYAFNYVISASNTWEQKTITVPGETTGTWLTDNNIGIALTFDLGSGSTYRGTANSWSTSDLFAPTGSTNLVGTNGATFYITGVQLEKGSTATSFDYRPYGTELALCQRYYELLEQTGTVNDRPFGIGGAYNASGQVWGQACVFFKVIKRASPTVTFTGASTFGQHSPGAFRNILTSISLNTASTTALQLNTISGTSGGSATAQGIAMILEAANGQTASIGISAEL